MMIARGLSRMFANTREERKEARIFLNGSLVNLVLPVVEFQTAPKERHTINGAYAKSSYEKLSRERFCNHQPPE